MMRAIQRANIARIWTVCAILTLVWSLTIVAQTPEQKTADTEYQEGAVLWTQNSGERIALAYQAFTLARIQLDKDLRTNRKGAKHRAVVVDIDETVLDNSRYQATQAKN